MRALKPASVAALGSAAECACCDGLAATRRCAAELLPLAAALGPGGPRNGRQRGSADPGAGHRHRTRLRADGAREGHLDRLSRIPPPTMRCGPPPAWSTSRPALKGAPDPAQAMVVGARPRMVELRRQLRGHRPVRRPIPMGARPASHHLAAAGRWALQVGARPGVRSRRRGYAARDDRRAVAECGERRRRVAPSHERGAARPGSRRRCPMTARWLEHRARRRLQPHLDRARGRRAVDADRSVPRRGPSRPRTARWRPGAALHRVTPDRLACSSCSSPPSSRCSW